MSRRRVALLFLAEHAVLALAAGALGIAWAASGAGFDAGLALGAALLAFGGSLYYFQEAFLPREVHGKMPPPPPDAPPPPP